MTSLITFDHVVFAVKHPPRMILQDINLHIAKNDFVIILGSNGSGKSSLLKLLDRRYFATSGEVKLHDKPLEAYSAKDFAKILMTLTQNPLDSLFANLTVYENCVIAFEQTGKKQARFKDYIKSYLHDFNPNLPQHLDSLAGSLSGGEQQALALALACLASPEILLLDEHTSALDPHAAERLMNITYEMVRRFHITCLLTTHNLEIAQNYGTRLIAIQHGQVVQDYAENAKSALSIQDLRKYCY